MNAREARSIGAAELCDPLVQQCRGSAESIGQSTSTLDGRRRDSTMLPHAMKYPAAIGLVIVVFASTACGGPEATAPKDYPCPDGTRVPQASMCRASQPPPADSTTAPPSTTVNVTPPPAPTDGALPRPKPTTIPLGKTGDEKLDAMLADGDKAFEAGDLAKALAAYEGAKKAYPKKAAPIIGV